LAYALPTYPTYRFIVDGDINPFGKVVASALSYRKLRRLKVFGEEKEEEKKGDDDQEEEDQDVYGDTRLISPFDVEQTQLFDLHKWTGYFIRSQAEFTYSDDVSDSKGAILPKGKMLLVRVDSGVSRSWKIIMPIMRVPISLSVAGYIQSSIGIDELPLSPIELDVSNYEIMCKGRTLIRTIIALEDVKYVRFASGLIGVGRAE
jgi:hypothetical protein